MSLGDLRHIGGNHQVQMCTATVLEYRRFLGGSPQRACSGQKVLEIAAYIVWADSLRDNRLNDFSDVSRCIPAVDEN